jgi:hypothetical protein
MRFVAGSPGLHAETEELVEDSETKNGDSERADENQEDLAQLSAPSSSFLLSIYTVRTCPTVLNLH